MVTLLLLLLPPIAAAPLAARLLFISSLFAVLPLLGSEESFPTLTILACTISPEIFLVGI
jgi:hypothetical protein